MGRDVGDHFIDVHVALGARPGLPDRQWELVVKLTLSDPLRRAANGAGLFSVKQTQLAVGGGGGPLDQRHGANQLDGHALLANREVAQAACGLGSPANAGRDDHIAQAVGQLAHRVRRAAPRVLLNGLFHAQPC